MGVTVTGVPGTSVTAATTVPAAAEFVTSAGLQTALQSPENDLASLKLRAMVRAPGALPHSATLHTASFIDIATANRWAYNGGGASPNDNYLKLREATTTMAGGLISGDWIHIATGPAVAGGRTYTVYREDGTTALAEIWGGGQWVELVWDGSQWRYRSSPPWVPNGSTPINPNPYYGDVVGGTFGVVIYTANL